MAEIQNAVVLSSSLPPIYGKDRDIIANQMGYTKARVDGSDSFYIVYRKADFHDDVDSGSSDSYIVNSTNDVNLGFIAKSTQGWDKTGITVLEHAWFCGTGQTYKSSNPDITDHFPPGDRAVSSFIVMKGVWSLYTEKNYKGIKISIDGEVEFGPGRQIHSLGPANDKV